MSTKKITLFGIRHHGPGSARSLQRALEAMQPDCILIEGPPDAEQLIPLVNDPGMVPPVAMLLYNPKNLAQAAIYPFAEFSPEWVAMSYSLRTQIPARFMDLPQGISLVLKAEKEENKQLTLQLEDESPSPEEALLRLDPFTRMARLAGYSDSERWWEAMFERNDASDEAGIFDTFESIVGLMRDLRDDKSQYSRPETHETMLREAQMRQCIRQAQKEGFRSIAVVCGAWHTPALADTDQIKASADAALLKGLKKIKTDATWIPWSFDRLSLENGYGAGVLSPAWYRLLFAKNEHATAEWLTQVARLLREHDLMASTAHIMDAARLADTLALLRHTQRPGIEELREAAHTVMTDGATKPLELIDRLMVVGDVLGAVPDSVAMPPLKDDFEKKILKYGLKKNTIGDLVELDLRKPPHLAKSQFLHRLVLLGLKWGEEKAVTGNKEGRFHENWQMKWLPDFEIKIIEAGTWGNTVEEAATEYAMKNINETESLTELTALLGTTLKADLLGLLPGLLQKMRSLTALSKDVLVLADALVPLTNILRYGHARAMNIDAIEQLIAQIAPRVCVQMPSACVAVAEEVAMDMLRILFSVNRAFSLLQRPDFEAMWRQALSAITNLQAASPMLAGLAARLLFDKTLLDAAQISQLMRMNVSQAVEARLGAEWVEGFLQGSGLLLLHHPGLMQILDQWVNDLDFEVFRELLPLLRRTFSKFSQPEREKMLDWVKKGALSDEHQQGTKYDFQENERTRAVMPLLRLILGA